MNSNTMITAVSPLAGEGTRAHVTVTTPEGTSGTKVPDEFGYMKSCQEAVRAQGGQGQDEGGCDVG